MQHQLRRLWFVSQFSQKAAEAEAKKRGGRSRSNVVGSVKGANGKKKTQAIHLDGQMPNYIRRHEASDEIFIRCDSSQFGAGAVLFQLDEQGQAPPA
jgi:hypothetical protein